jgi:ethanolamine utilization protein EutQ (cupin superfamily)
MWEKWHEIVFFPKGSSITMGKMAENNVGNRKWYKYGKNGGKWC